MRPENRKVGSWSSWGVRALLPLCCVVGCAVANEEPTTSAGATALVASPVAQLAFDVGRSGDPSVPSIAVDGDTALAGGPEAVGGGGAVFVYTRTAGGWAATATLAPPEPGGIFGYRVALAGDTAAVSARMLVGTMFVPVVYVYERTGGTWTFTARLERGLGDDGFGEAIAMTSRVLVIAAPRGTEPCGAVYVYERGGGVWAPTATLASPVCAVFGRFGDEVAVDGHTIVVGAAHQGGTGAAYVYTRRGGGWAFSTALTPADPQASLFGRALAIDGRQIAIGAFGTDASTGAVYVFERSGVAWQQQAKLVPDGAAPGDFVGFSVALERGVLATGALLANEVTVFAEARGAWTEHARLTGDSTGTSYGFRVDLSRDTLGVFGFIPGTSTPYLGALYLYELAR